MRSAVLLMVSCILLSLVSTHLAQVSVPTAAEPVWCPEKDVFPGTCGDRGRNTCFLDFLGSRSASSMPKNCSCTPQGSDKRLCQCFVVCNQN